MVLHGIYREILAGDSKVVVAHEGCTDTVREPALEVDSGRKIPCRTGDSNPRQYCAWLFSRTLYQMSYLRTFGKLDLRGK